MALFTKWKERVFNVDKHPPKMTSSRFPSLDSTLQFLFKSIEKEGYKIVDCCEQTENRKRVVEGFTFYTYTGTCKKELTHKFELIISYNANRSSKDRYHGSYTISAGKNI